VTEGWLDAFEAWFQANEARLAAAGLTLGQLARTPATESASPDGAAASADVWAEAYVGRVTLHPTGGCDMAVLDAHSGAVVLSGQAQIASHDHLAETLTQFCATVRTGLPPLDPAWSQP
jgi:hypothetical protein